MSRAGKNAKSAFTPKTGLLLLAVLLLTAIAPSGAAAAPPEASWTRCAANSESDISCAAPRGVATAPASAGPGVAGNVFVAESSNRRIAEFTAWGQFVKTWGWDVVQSGPDDNGVGFEICAPANGDICKAGIAGTGAGQLGGPQGVAVDSEGNVYVLDRGLPSNQRVQKFDPEGHFLAMWGGGVNKGPIHSGANVCTAQNIAEGDSCGAGTTGTANGQFGALSTVGSYIAIDTLGTPSAADDKVYVGDQERIQRFDVNGAYQSQIAIPGEKVRALAVDPSGNLYASFCGASCAFGEAAKANVRKWSSAGLELGTITVANPQALATDAAAELFVVDGTSNPTIRQFSSAGTEVPAFAFKDSFSESTGIATGSACLSSGYDLYVVNFGEPPKGFLRAYGPVPDEAHAALCPPPPHAPEIVGQATLSVETELAMVQASINPKFWADTSYRVQYASAECIEGEPLGWEASCVSETPEAQLGAGVTDAVAQSAKVSLAVLTPATEYRYRFAATSSGGGPVFGRGGSEGEEGEEGAFTTPAVLGPPPPDGCPNAPFRSGPSALLPDCRAYEMVSPVDKHGGDILNGAAGFYYDQVSTDGERITYSAAPSFGDQPSGKFNNQYLATRNEGEGWSDRGINAPLGRQLGGTVLISREAELFTPDLCSEWLIDFNATPLAPAGREGYVNLYRHDLCGASGFEALSTTEPALAGEAKATYLSSTSVQGSSATGDHVLFVAEAGLTPEALPGPTVGQIYDRFGGELHLVSVLPGGVADPGNGSNGAGVGGGAGLGLFAGANFGGVLAHAVSSDGSRVFWISGLHLSGSAEGKLYLREHPEQGIVAGECSEPSKACTVPVSSGKATFWGATPSGSEALYSEGTFPEDGPGLATLYRFDSAAKASSQIATGLRGVLGTSEDLSRIYYVSTDVLTPGQKNGEGDEAQAGEANLYLDEEGTRTFIATLINGKDGDVAAEAPVTKTYSIGSFDPYYNAVRVTRDGAHVVFESRAPLTHYDNTDRSSGKPDVEVFSYEAAGALRCVSCNPTGVRPSGHEMHSSYASFATSNETGVWGAAWIPAFEHQLYSSNVLSQNGGRIFFNSYDSLLRHDTNGTLDVYEWEAPGIGGCTTESAAFHKANGGCLYLISTGESPVESEFWDANSDGRDVFFTTESSLLPQDPGHFDLYDARVGGGFPQPTPLPNCEGEACQSPPPPPNDQTPASASFKGPGNPSGAGAKPRCAKGKRLVRRGAKPRCVAKHKRNHKRGANNNRRAAR